MQGRKRLLSGVLAIAMAVGFASCGDSQNGSAEGEYAPAEVGEEMRDFTAETLSGESFTLSEQKGKVILLNFWATWCGPCVGEMPAFPELIEKYGDELCLVAVNCGEDKETVESFMEDNGYSFTVLTDEDYAISDMYPTDGIPYTVIFDRDGNIAHIQLGADTSEKMLEMYSETIDTLV